jgi:hypothetical protein
MADRAEARNFLFTFAHDGARACALNFAEQNRRDLRLFIDSGAFTAWKQEIPIDLDEYMSFCRGITDRARCPLTFAALDVIAGTYSGPTPSSEDFETACAQGWRNYLTMKENGIKSVPTFHQGDDWKWLDKLAGDTDYIALAPRKKGKTTKEKFKWLNECYRRLGKHAYDGSLKIHGLGIASPPMMETFPFYSVDSTSVQVGQRGCPYHYFDGYRLKVIGREEWDSRVWDTQLAYDCVGDPSTIEARYRYRGPGEKQADGQFGTYWFVEQAMASNVQIERYLTKHWEHRGVIWDATQNRKSEALELEGRAVAVDG